MSFHSLNILLTSKLLSTIAGSLLLLTTVLLAGCHEGLRSTAEIPTGCKCSELKAINLSESITKNDEIELHTLFIQENQRNGLRKINHFVFDEVNKSLGLFHEFNIDHSHGYFVFVLIEQDAAEDQSADTNQILFVELSKQLFIDNPREILRLDELIGDDDVLDLKYLSVEEIRKKKSFELQFEGLHLFDRFEYTLYCKTN